MDPVQSGDLLFSPAIAKAIVDILTLIGNPFLIVSVIVVVLMYRLLQRKEKTFDSSMKDVFNELHQNALLITEQAATIKTLVDILKGYDIKRKENREEDS